MLLNHYFSECPFTVYGPNCNTSCSEHCQHRLCNHTTGHCLACDDGRSGNLCENELPAKGEHRVFNTGYFFFICYLRYFFDEQVLFFFLIKVKEKTVTMFYFLTLKHISFQRLLILCRS